MNATKKKILIVDDDGVIVTSLSIKLKANGFDVVSARDGSTAVSAVRTQKPDAILLDINFPPEFLAVTWDGFQIMEWLRRLEEGSKIPIFIITSGDPEKYVSRARDLGAVAFFRKPVVHEQLIAALHRILKDEPAAVS
ncbi:MAG: response regulator [Verrucomicrobiota bacterium]|jgi:two-component system, OmpR family, KDP operon response regulator KdpE